MPYNNELQAAKAAVQQACRLCSAAQRGLVDSERLDKADKSPVTVADYGSQAIILESLEQRFPEIPAVAEEDASELRRSENLALLDRVSHYAQKVAPHMDSDAILRSLDRGRHAGGASTKFWTLDPIDGTKGFLRGQQYAVALALIDEGKVVLGVLGCPNLDANPLDAGTEKGCLLYAVAGQGAYQSPLSDIGAARPIRADKIADPSKATLCESVESGHTAHGRSRDIAAKLGTSVPPFRIDSQCKYAAVSRGQASIYLRLPTRPGYEEKIWDHAAGYRILIESGGKVSDTLGKALDFTQGKTLSGNKGVVATSPGVFEPVLEAVLSSAQ